MLAICVACALVVATVMKSAGQFVLVRVMPVPELAWAQLISNMAAPTVAVPVPVMLLMVMLFLGRQHEHSRP